MEGLETSAHLGIPGSQGEGPPEVRLRLASAAFVSTQDTETEPDVICARGESRRALQNPTRGV